MLSEPSREASRRASAAGWIRTQWTRATAAIASTAKRSDTGSSAVFCRAKLIAGSLMPLTRYGPSTG